MRFSLTTLSDTELRVSLSGELQSDALSDNFCAMLNKDQHAQINQAKTIILDCSDVDRVDTSGLAWLLNAVRDLKAQDKQVSIKQVPQKVADLAALSNAESLLD